MNARAITAELDDATVALVDSIAAARGITSAAFAAAAIRDAVAREAAADAFVQLGIDQVERGETVDHDEVMRALEAMIARHRARCG
ncbi:CopG family transcriptional regulator [Sphingomonas yunnanensis]|uniref:CopG family transcriptional regulator n=1 Tax=Sphingomonas yunnanensis TaxID=310400 RepID=UPI001CA6B9F2|nr:CopG family transcriptional regulator [Sphingomonas yunnanensis]MBY9064552.1 CopG family transcriptional regulator [Sphingomonas yunnanensis]